MRIIKNREHHTHISYSLDFSYINPPQEFRGSGFSFECDKEGNVNPLLLHKCARENYKNCLSGKDWRLVGVQYAYDRNDPEGGYDGYKPVLCTGRWEELTFSKGRLVEHTNRYVEPAVGECNHCGEEVHLTGFTNTCECGTDYNMSGQELAPREQWGEETGESLADILSADTDAYEEECPPTVRSQREPLIVQEHPIQVEVVV